MHRYIYLGSLEILSYDLFNAIAFFAAILCNLCMFRQKQHLLSARSQIYLRRDPKKRNAYIILETLIVSCAQFFIGSACNAYLAKITVGAGANYFGLALFSPFLLIAFLWLIRINPLKQMDLITPAYAITLTIFKFACFMHGCCEGKPSPYGLYFPCRDQYEIPSQLIEMAVAFLIFLVLLLLMRKYRSRAPGCLYPIYLILYSATRFMTEFTRCNTPVLWLLQPYHLYCLAGVLVGFVELLVVRKFGQRISDAFDKRNAEIIRSSMQ